MTFDPEAHPMLLKECKQLMSPLAWTLPGRGSGGVSLMLVQCIMGWLMETKVYMCVVGDGGMSAGWME